MHFNRIAGNVFIPGIKFFFNFFFAHHPVAVQQQKFQQGCFFRCQQDFFAVEQGLPGLRIKADLAVIYQCSGLAAAAADQGIEPGDDFPEGKRFCQIVVGTGIQAFYSFFNIAAGSKNKHRF